MAYTQSKFQAEFLLGLVDRVQAVLERDADAAVEEWNEGLDYFRGYEEPLENVTKFPSLYLVPLESELDQADDDQSIAGVHQIAVGVAVVAPTATLLKRRAMQYLIAIDRVLRTMSAADLTGGVTTTKARPAWEVTRHAFGPLTGEGKTYRRDASLILKVQLTEL